ncbi:MAG: hypothetical protein HY371_18700, partial [Devosia nanyangense]|nr:hypothetical protein [Devosia nanyangense]
LAGFGIVTLASLFPVTGVLILGMIIAEVQSPQEIIDKTMSFREGFGDYQRQLWVVDAMGLPVETALEQVELLATEVVPVLRKEMAALRSPTAAEAPTHASMVKTKYGDAPASMPTPNPIRGDNVTGSRPFQDTADGIAAKLPLVG